MLSAISSAIMSTRSGAHLARLAPCLVDDRGFATTNSRLEYYCLRLLMCTINSTLKRVDKFKELFCNLSDLASKLLIALVELAQGKFHGCSHAISTPSTWLIQSANVATRCFPHLFCGCPADRRRYQQNGLLCWSYHEQFRLLNQALLTSTCCDMQAP